MKSRKSSRNQVVRSHASVAGQGGGARPAGLMLWLLLGAAAHSQTLNYDIDPATSGAQDGSGTWNSSATPMNWWASAGGGTNSKWTNQPAATATTHAVFGSGGTGGVVTLGAGMTANHITVNTSGYTLSGGDLTLGGVTPTITTNADATIESAITNSLGLTKDGGATLTLAGSSTNNITGQTTVKEGTLVLKKSTSNTTLRGNASGNTPDLVIGDGTGTDTVQLGANDQLADTMEVVLNAAGTPVLDLNGYSETIGSILSTNTAASLLLGAGTLTVQNGTGSGATDFAGVISGTGGLIKQGSAVFTLSGTSANTYAGTTTVSNGDLTLNKTSGVDAIAGNPTPGTPDLVIGTGATAATVTLGASHQIKDTAQVSIGGSGASKLILNGKSETIASLESANTSAVVDLAPGGTLTVQNGLGGASTDTEYKGSIIGAGGNLVLDGGAAATFTLSGTAANSATGSTTVKAGTLQLNKSGADAVTGDGASGTPDLIIGDGGGTDTVRLGAANQISDGAEVWLKSSSGVPVFDLNNFNETIGSLAGTNYNAEVRLGSGTLTVKNGSTAASTLSDYAGVITGTGGLILAGGAVPATNTFTLSGTLTNTFSGATVIGSPGAQGGTLILNKTPGVNAIAGSPTASTFGTLSTYDVNISFGVLQLTRGDQIADTAEVILSDNRGSFDLNSNNETIASLSTDTNVNALVTLGSGTLTLQNGKTVSSGNTSAALGISGNGGSIVLDAGSASTFTMTGNSYANTYTGTTTVKEGTLILSKGLTAIAGDATAGTPDLIIGDGTGTTEAVRLNAIDQIANTVEVTLNAAGTPTFNLNGQTDTIGSLATTNNAASVTLGAGALTLANGLAPGSTDSTYAGTISGTGTLTLNAGSTNTFTLAGTAANTYTGATTVSGGTLLLNKTPGVNAIAGTITIGDGTGTDTLKLAAADQIANTSAITLNPTATPVFNLNNFSETVASLTSTNNTAAITLGTGTLTLANTASTTYTGIITGAGGLTMSGTNAISQTLSGTNANTYTGPTTITGGTLILQKTAGIDAIVGNTTTGTPDIIIGDGTGADTLQLAASNQINDNAEVVLSATGTGVNAPIFNLNSQSDAIGSLASTNASASVTLGSGTLTLQNGKTASSGDTTYAGVISGSGGINLTAGNANTFTLSGVNTYTGATTLTSGTLALDHSVAGLRLSPSTTIVLSNGTTLALTGATGSQNEVVASTTVTGVAQVTRSGGNTATINLGTLSIAAGNQLEIQATGIGKTSTANTNGILPRVTINDQLVKNDGSGNIVPLSGADFTNVPRLGGTIPNNSTNNVQITDTGNTTGNVSLAGATTINTLTNSATGGLATVDLGNNVLTLGASGVITNTDPSGLTLTTAGSGSLTSGGSILVLNSAPAPITISAPITGAITLDKAGSGNLTLTGTTANTYTGLTTVNEGTLLLNKTAGINAIAGNLTINGGTTQLGASNQIADAATVILANPASVLDLNGFSDTIGTLTSTQNTASILLGASGSGILTVTGTTNNYAGTLAGTGGFTTSGTNTTLSGTLANTNAGPITVSAGTLTLNKTAGTDAVAGNATAATPDLVIGTTATAATLTLAAANQINNTAEVTLGGTGTSTFNLATFAETIGSLASTNTAATTTLGTNGSLTLQNGKTAASDSSTYNGNITGSNATLTLDAGTGKTFTLGGTVANTYTGPTTVLGGTLILNKTATLNNITGDGTAGTNDLIISNTGAVQLNTANQLADNTEVLLSATGTPTFNLNGLSDAIGSLATTNTAATLALGSGTLTVNNGSGSNATTFAGAITGTGGLTKAGTADFTLTGTTANTYTGLTTLSSGALNLSKTPGTNAIGGNITYTAASTLNLLADNQIADTSQINFGASSYAAILNLNDRNETVGSITSANTGGRINLGTGTLTVAAGTGTFGSTITGTGNTILNGANTFTYTNSYTGSTTIASGSLTLSTSGSLTGNTTSGTPDVIIGNSATAATLNLGVGGLAATSEVVLGGSGIQTLALANSVAESIASLASTNNNAVVSLGDAASILTLTNGNSTTPAASTDSNYAGTITGAGGITLNAGASNNFTLSGTNANTNTGLTTVTQGTLVLDKSDNITAIAGNVSLGAGTVRLNSTEQIANTATVTLTTATSLFDLNGYNETVANLTTLAGSTVALGSGNLTLSGGTSTVSGSITGTGNVTTGGTYTFGGTTSANTHTGSTTVSSGTLTLSKNAGVNAIVGNASSGTADLIIGDGTGADTVTWGSANQVADTAEVVLTAGGTPTMNLAGNAETIGSLASTNAGATVTLGAATLTLQNGKSGASGNTVYAGTITGSGGLTADLAPGASFTLTGTNGASTSTGYYGATTVNNGTLALDYSTPGERIVDSSALTLNNGTLALVGSTGGTVETITNATITGNSSITRSGGTTATLKLTNLTVNAGSLLDIQAANLVSTTSNNSTSGILNGVTIGGQLATKNAANGVNGGIILYSAFTNVNRLGGTLPNTPAANVSIIEAGTSGIVSLAGGAGSTTDINTLTNSGTGGLSTVDLTGKTLRLGATGLITNAAGSQGLTLSAGTLTAGGAANTAGQLSVFNDTPSPTTISSVIANNGAGAVALTKSGTGELILSGGSNTNTGATTVNEGTLTLSKTAGADAVLGNTGSGSPDLVIHQGTVRLANANQIANTAEVRLTADTSVLDLNGKDETIASLASAPTAFGANVALGSGTLTVLNGLNANSTASTYHGTLSGTGGLILAGAGTSGFTLAGTQPNTYAGTTDIAMGTLTLAKTPGVNAIAGDVSIGNATLTLAASNQIADTAALTFGTNATGAKTFNLDGFDETVSSINATSPLAAINTGGGTLTLANTRTGPAADTLYAGSLNGTGNLVVNNPAGSTLALTGVGSPTLAASNLSGKVLINSGNVTAAVNGSNNSLGSAAVNIAAGNTLTYQLSTAGGNVGATAFTGDGTVNFQMNSAAGNSNLYTKNRAFDNFTGLIHLTTDTGATTGQTTWAMDNLSGAYGRPIDTPASVLLDPGTSIFVHTGTVNVGGGITVSGTGDGATSRGALGLYRSTLNTDVTLAGNTTLGLETATINGDFTNTGDSVLTLTNHGDDGAGNTLNGAIADGAGITSLSLQGGNRAFYYMTGGRSNTYTGPTLVTGGNNPHGTAAGNNLELRKTGGAQAITGDSTAGTPDLIIGDGIHSNIVSLSGTGNQISDTAELAFNGTTTTGITGTSSRLDLFNLNETVGSISSANPRTLISFNTKDQNNNGGGNTFTVRNGMPGVGDNTTFAGVIDGYGSFVLDGGNTGNFTLSGVPTYSASVTYPNAGTTTVNGGNLALDYDANPTTGKLNDAARLTINNGSVTMAGNNSSYTEKVSGTLGTLITGSAEINRTGTNTSEISLGALVIEPASLLAVQSEKLANTTTNNTNGYLPNVTVGGVIAMNDGMGNIVAYNNFTDVYRLGGTGGFDIPNSSSAHVRIVEGAGALGTHLDAPLTTISTLTNSATGGRTFVNLGAGETLRLGQQGLITNSTDSKGLTISGPGHLTAGGANNSSGVIIAANDTPSFTTITSIISDNGSGVVSLAKMGDGLVLLNNTSAQTYTGTTTVNRGPLQVGFAGVGSTGTGATTVENTGTLLGTGTVKSAVFTAQTGATIAPGDSTDPTSYGTLHFAGDSPGSTNFQTDSLTSLGIATSNTNDPTYGGNLLGTPGYYAWARAADGGGTHDTLDFGGTAVSTLNFGGDLVVDATGWTMVSRGQVFDLMDWGPNVTANFANFDTGPNYRDGSRDNGSQFNLPDISAYGLLWDVSLFKETGKIIAVPEPSNVVLSGLGAATLLFRRRRAA